MNVVQDEGFAEMKVNTLMTGLMLILSLNCHIVWADGDSMLKNTAKHTIGTESKAIDLAIEQTGMQLLGTLDLLESTAVYYERLEVLCSDFNDLES
ncbi:MAG: hypothetical protein JSV44_10305 [Candidatus Zixiibacteriota bacterium]|nr:MAG: hypothetical protein JSV44_10305 [candidate division Zixibacteria bacterium]